MGGFLIVGAILLLVLAYGGVTLSDDKRKRNELFTKYETKIDETFGVGDLFVLGEKMAEEVNMMSEKHRKRFEPLFKTLRDKVEVELNS